MHLIWLEGVLAKIPMQMQFPKFRVNESIPVRLLAAINSEFLNYTLQSWLVLCAPVPPVQRAHVGFCTWKFLNES